MHARPEKALASRDGVEDVDGQPVMSLPPEVSAHSSKRKQSSRTATAQDAAGDRLTFRKKFVK